MDDKERRAVEEEIRSLEAVLAEYRRDHPDDWIQIQAFENQIHGKRAYIKGWS